MPSEFDFIQSLRQHSQLPGVVVGIGDDCAVLEPLAQRWLVTTDLLTEGVDFLLAEATPEAIGKKAMGVNLSDIAAMAGVPKFAVVAVALPRHPPGGMTTRALADRLDAGVREMAARFGVAIVGGDTNTWDQGLVISITLIGESTARGPVLRSGAKLDDAIFVTGPLGGSLLGRHLSPEPRVREALALHQIVDLHAMIDISDGLTADLMHILEESHFGADLDSMSIPIHPDAVLRSAITGQTPLHHALHDGEDFELIFTVSQADAEKLTGQFPRIGTITDTGLTLDGQPLTPRGWVHEV
jgi:thiamine-monophosphate kinase